jgi:hypothetical protein
MAQHDYVIDNQASAAARADLNSLFQAIASQNSGATAPATTYANMFWYDTSTYLLKMRNAANSGWITLGTVDQTNNVFNPNFLPATQAEAEAGSNNVKGMTPLRVSQAIAVLGGLGGVNIQVFTASGTYTPTSGYKRGIAFVTGGGRGGSSSSTFGSGGDAGGTVIDVLNLSSIGTPTITVGAGGGSNIAGGASSIGATISAYGGGTTAAYTGLVQIEGGKGSVGFQYAAGSGRSGFGGGSFWGSGGGVSSGTGVAAFAYGSGGGGGFNASGGSGKSGIVMIMEFK